MKTLLFLSCFLSLSSTIFAKDKSGYQDEFISMSSSIVKENGLTKLKITIIPKADMLLPDCNGCFELESDDTNLINFRNFDCFANLDRVNEIYNLLKKDSSFTYEFLIPKNKNIKSISVDFK